MRYLMLIACDPGDYENADDAIRQSYVDAHNAFTAYVEAHGAEYASAALAGGDTATTVAHRDGRPVVTDGPFAEIAEQIGGYYDVDLPDLDTAIAAAQLLPAVYRIEIRPTVTVP